MSEKGKEHIPREKEEKNGKQKKNEKRDMEKAEYRKADVGGG
jgi:hypothetical protein